MEAPRLNTVRSHISPMTGYRTSQLRPGAAAEGRPFRRGLLVILMESGRLVVLGESRP